MKYNKDKDGNALLTDQQSQELYLQYVNNYLTVKKFAEDHGLHLEDAQNILVRGKLVNERKGSK